MSRVRCSEQSLLLLKPFAQVRSVGERRSSSRASLHTLWCRLARNRFCDCSLTAEETVDIRKSNRLLSFLCDSVELVTEIEDTGNINDLRFVAMREYLDDLRRAVRRSELNDKEGLPEGCTRMDVIYFASQIEDVVRWALTESDLPSSYVLQRRIIDHLRRMEGLDGSQAKAVSKFSEIIKSGLPPSLSEELESCFRQNERKAYLEFIQATIGGLPTSTAWGFGEMIDGAWGDEYPPWMNMIRVPRYGT